MAILKAKTIAKMNEQEINEKLWELKIEAIKIKVGKKIGKTSQREIRKTIARLLTFKGRLNNAKTAEPKAVAGVKK